MSFISKMVEIGTG